MSGVAYFITGTDTDVGKTLVATGLLDAARRLGLDTIGLKPVAAGVDGQHGGAAGNVDAVALRAAATTELDYAAVNPVLLKWSVAPHIAAAAEGVRIDVAEVATQCRRALAIPHDLAVIEGAGGWLVPLNETETCADLCIALELPAILVVRMKLGCLNHALLTAAAIRAAGGTLAGWVANCADADMPAQRENIDALRQRMAAPLLGCIPRLGVGDTAAGYLDLDTLRDA